MTSVHEIEVGYVVLHAGHEVTVPLELRVALGAVAGLVAAIVLTPVFLLVDDLRSGLEAASGDLVGQRPPRASSQAVILLGGGLLTGGLFELVTVAIERVRPVVILVGGRIALADLLAVALVAGLVAVGLRRASGPATDRTACVATRVALTVGAVYGLVLLTVASLLYRYLEIPV